MCLFCSSPQTVLPLNVNFHQQPMLPLDGSVQKQLVLPGRVFSITAANAASGRNCSNAARVASARARLSYNSLSCNSTCLFYSRPCHLWTCLCRLCSTAACAVPGRVWSSAAYAAPGRVCFTTACAAPERVFSTSVLGVPLPVCVSVLQQSVLPRSCLASSSLYFTRTYLFNSSLCCSRRCMAYSSLCCTWTCLSTKAFYFLLHLGCLSSIEPGLH